MKNNQNLQSTVSADSAPPSITARALSVAFRLTLIAFLGAGAIVTFGQIASIALGSGATVVHLADLVGDPACIIAGVSGLFAFLGLYARKPASLQ